MGLQDAVPPAEEDHGDAAVTPSNRPALCARDRADAVRDVFCAEAPPTIRSLRDLQQALRLIPEGGGDTGLADGDNAVVVSGHSTALSGHLVSPINPRLIIIGIESFMAYQRGLQKVEVIAAAREKSGISLNFYLFRFEQACNRAPEGCSPGDLYTPKVERDWLSVSLEDDEDLKNTPNDCRQCHQRGRELPTILMRELNAPWTHFFQLPVDLIDGIPPAIRGSDLLQDYLGAKGDERYGGFAMEQLFTLGPNLLENAAGDSQPLLFDAPGIESERWPYDPATGDFPLQPGPSPSWERAYEAFKRGEQLALPYLETRASDPGKQARLSEAYTRYRAGELSESELPNLGDIFPDDALERARIGLQTEPDAAAEESLIQACGGCHNDVLDQSISRARFNINLWRLDAREIALAIERIERSPSEPGVMPPPEARQLDRGGRDRLLQYLRQDPLAREPDPRLVRAAELGMAGGSGPL